jgi:hypothetical protein
MNVQVERKPKETLLRDNQKKLVFGDSLKLSQCGA